MSGSAAARPSVPGARRTRPQINHCQALPRVVSHTGTKISIPESPSPPRTARRHTHGPHHHTPTRRPAPAVAPRRGTRAAAPLVEGKILTYPCSNAATLVMEDEVISQTELKPAPQRTNMIGFCEASGRTLPRQVPISSVAGSGRPAGRAGRGGAGWGGRRERAGGGLPPCLTWPRVTCLRFLRIIV